MRNTLEQLIQSSPVPIIESDLPGNFKGLYVESKTKNVILINRNIKRSVELRCVVAEELGHHHTSAGEILDQRDIRNRKQEKLARSWAYKYLVPLSVIVQAHRDGVSGRHEFAEYLNVDEDFLQSAIDRYKEQFGLYTTYGRYIIYFDPLGVVESFE